MPAVVVAMKPSQVQKPTAAPWPMPVAPAKRTAWLRTNAMIREVIRSTARAFGIWARIWSGVRPASAIHARPKTGGEYQMAPSTMRANVAARMGNTLVVTPCMEVAPGGYVRAVIAHRWGGLGVVRRRHPHPCRYAPRPLPQVRAR